MYVYLAGPRPHSAYKQAAIANSIRAKGWAAFDPWRAWCGGIDRPFAAAAILNLEAVTRSAVVFGHLSETATGTGIEIGYALAHGVPVILWGSLDEGLMVRHPAIHHGETIDDALDLLDQFIAPIVGLRETGALEPITSA
jgi:nucleoside 2-deoxyribosyltransferase